MLTLLVGGGLITCAYSALMGFGGIVGLGCTIGQGISGFSTLALGSIITFLAIVAGSAATMKYQDWRVARTQ